MSKKNTVLKKKIALPLLQTHPELSRQWHPIKNSSLTPALIKSGSTKKVWWKCDRGPDHEWEAKIEKRSRSNGSGCPICANQKIVPSNSLLMTHPKIAAQWHLTKNADLTPDSIGAGSGQRVWWKCEMGDDHEWQTSPNKRTSADKTNCPVCSNKKIVPSNSLLTTHPEIAGQWHSVKNGANSPDLVGAGSNKKVWWKCSVDDEHEWEAVIVNRTKINGSGCPICANQKIVLSNSLLTTHPEIAAQWHPKKNGDLRPDAIGSGSSLKVWWKCALGDEHEWMAVVESRTGKSRSGCPICSNRKIIFSKSLAATHPEIAVQWHPTRNGISSPESVSAGSSKKAWWICPLGDEHVWEAVIASRAKINGAGCPICSKRKAVFSTSLLTTHPSVAKEWHPTKNVGLFADAVSAGSNIKVWWACKNVRAHEWKAKINDRTKEIGTGCPVCNSGWTIGNIKLFISSLLPNIQFLTSAELHVIFQQNGLVNHKSKSGSLIKALKANVFPKDELEKFANGEVSSLDSYVSTENVIHETKAEHGIDELQRHIHEKNLSTNVDEFPVVETQDVLASLDNKVISNVDQEAAEFFINSAVAKIWKHVFLNETEAIEQLEVYEPGLYAGQVKSKFVEQYTGAKNLNIPGGYSFSIGKKHIRPNLMQKYTAFLVKEKKRVGNWSGTGAGKTLSAVLSSRVIDATLTLICCPNSVVAGWQVAINNIYPDSVVFSKDLNFQVQSGQYHYVILNYEFFQQPGAEGRLKAFIEANQINFIVIDEIHYSKQRAVENMSKRKQVISAMLSEVSQKNDDLHVLGMSATPVINNLFEGKTLIELVTGVSHDDLIVVPTINNCISLYQKMVTHGIRWMPNYSQKLNLTTVEVDCSTYIEEIGALGIKGTMVDLEAILTKAKLPEILNHIRPKTIIYTHYLKNIVIPLQEAVEADGWKASVYSGDDKSGLESFLKGNTDVLIATSCIATGVDGLQTVCNRIIINTLPWTHAEFEQLRGRVYRQGQKEDSVDIIVPLTFADINAQRWSWCESRWKRIQFKKSIADAAVDGIIPDGQLRSSAQAYQDAMSWLKRLEDGQLNEIERQKITLTLSEDETQRAHRKFGDFSNMNRIINATSSVVMHEKFAKDPQRWEYYHSLYRDARNEWSVIPYKEAIKWCNARPHLVVGDFGCGEALLAKAVGNQVHSFDHVAINESVIACDMSHVPLEDECLDAAIFSLSLMGANYIDYVKEAHRCLKLDGHLWIVEATSRYQNLTSFEDVLAQIGFDVVKVRERAQFTFLRAIKGD